MKIRGLALGDLPHRIYIVGDERRLRRWVRRIKGLRQQKYYNPSLSEDEVWATLFSPQEDFAYVHPASQDFESLVNPENTSYPPAIRTATIVKDDDGIDNPVELDTSQRNLIRAFLDTTKERILIFGSSDIGLGQMILSRIPFRRYYRIGRLLYQRLAALKQKLAIPHVAPITFRYLPSTASGEIHDGAERRIRVMSVVDQIRKESTAPGVACPPPTVSLDPYGPKHGWDPSHRYLQSVHFRIPSVGQYRRALEEHYLDRLADRQRLSYEAVSLAVFSPAFNADDFERIYTPDRRCYAKFIVNVGQEFEISKTNQRLTLKKIDEALNGSWGGLGFYASNTRTEFTLLLQLPAGTAWLEEFTPTDHLRALHAIVVARFGEPALCFRDKNGLVVTWALDRPVPNSQRLVEHLRSRINGIPALFRDQIQIRPAAADSKTFALQFPRSRDLVNVNTLLPEVLVADRPFNRVDPISLFGLCVLHPPVPRAQPFPVHTVLSANHHRLIATIAAAFPASAVQAQKLRNFLEELIKYLLYLHQNTKANHCAKKGPNFYAIPSTAMRKWEHGFRPILQRLNDLDILVPENAYTAAPDCVDPKSRCYKFDWHANPKPAPDIPAILRAHTVRQIATWVGVEMHTVKKYRKNPGLMPAKRQIMLLAKYHKALP